MSIDPTLAREYKDTVRSFRSQLTTTHKILEKVRLKFDKYNQSSDHGHVIILNISLHNKSIYRKLNIMAYYLDRLNTLALIVSMD